jgi:hypothetical protein
VRNVADVRDGGRRVVRRAETVSPAHALADLLKLPAEKVRVVVDAGSGIVWNERREDCAAARRSSRSRGPPVRCNTARGWNRVGPEGPADHVRMRAAYPAKIGFAWDYEARGFSGRVRNNAPEQSRRYLAGSSPALHRRRIRDWPQFPAESYAFPNVRKVSHNDPNWIVPCLRGCAPRTFASPDGMAHCFASESFADELAYATKMDPVEFRLRYITDNREAAAGEAVARKAGWEKRVGPNPRTGASYTVRNRVRAREPVDRGDRRQRRGGYTTPANTA